MGVKHGRLFAILHSAMSHSPRLKEKYQLAGCCTPDLSDKIVGYFSYDNLIKVHREGCSNLAKADAGRLVKLEWADIIEADDFTPGPDYGELEVNDFAILRHHLDFGVDYSLKVASMLDLPKAEVFERHKKLRGMGLLERVEPVMIRYRKGVVDNKWIKHRNHTYYQITVIGKQYLDYHEKSD